MSKGDLSWLRRRLEEVSSMRGYERSEGRRSLSKRMGIEVEKIVRLNANENLAIPLETISSLLVEIAEGTDPRLYGQVEEELELREALGRYTGVSGDYILLGSGSDQLIDLILGTFVGSGDGVVSIAPTFAIYGWRTELWGGRYLNVALKRDFSLDATGILDACDSTTRVCFICSPNNPTANQFDAEEIREVLDGSPGLVVVDEAYVEFADYSLVNLVEKFENLVILRTFSKTFGMAGLRLGYMIANPAIADPLLEKAQIPYSSNTLALRLGLKVLEDVIFFEEAVKKVKEERGRIIERMEEMRGVKPFGSKTNFVLFQVGPNEKKVYDGLAANGILVKRFGEVLGHPGCLRVTVATPEVNDGFLVSLEEIMGS